MSKYDWDHIDPDYPKDADRPYQLVCGLTNLFNLVELDRSSNSSKSNRFLPWRVAKDEIGSVPINFGDLCQFLNRETGEWVLEEFMGDWYREQTKDLCGEHVAGCRTRDEKTGLHAPGVASAGGQIGGTYPWWHNSKTGETVRSLKKPGPGWVNKRPIDWDPNKNLTPEELRKKCQAANACIRPESLSKGGVNAAKKKYLCLVTGFISNAPTVAHVQKCKGIDKSFRVSLDSVYFLIRTLCLMR